MNYKEIIKQIAKMISSGDIPKTIYNKYLSKAPIGFMNCEELENFLLKEELKKQLEVGKEQYNDLVEEKESLQEQLSSNTLQLQTQQKEFIKYLEDEINKCQSNIFADGVKYGFQLSLSKYKEMIVMNKKEMYIQYVIAYKRNNKWYRDGERHQNLKTASKRLEELKTKHEECKIVYRQISLWKDLITKGDSNVKD